MPLEFSCPHCGTTTLVEDQFAGHRGPCIGCTREIVVPLIPRDYRAAPSRANAVNSSWMLYGVITLCCLLVLATLGAGITFLVIPMVQVAQAEARRSQCEMNMQAIAGALLQYHREYQAFPPATVTDKAGTPLYSWRVLILPYLGPEGEQLHTEFRLQEPWDSPKNMSLVSRMPAVFNSPSDENSRFQFHTSYLVVTGNNSLFPPGKSKSISEILDATDETILFVEAKETGVVWSEPRDLVFGVANLKQGVDLGGNHPGGMQAAMADGSVKFLPQDIPVESIEAMVTPAGGDWTGGGQ